MYSIEQALMAFLCPQMKYSGGWGRRITPVHEARKRRETHRDPTERSKEGHGREAVAALKVPWLSAN